ncbi:MAG: 50S ribosomal protein L29 [Candidatus Daviesbacteria bacterium]|nr:50S ribosomal protein L29 [Candidatus Daviesbacteria bacterium]
MKKTEMTEIKKLDIKELQVRAKRLEKEIADLTLDKNMKKMKDTKMIHKKKKDLAQVLTVIKQKEQLSVFSNQLSDKSSSVVSQSDKQKTDARKTGGKK